MLPLAPPGVDSPVVDIDFFPDWWDVALCTPSLILYVLPLFFSLSSVFSLRPLVLLALPFSLTFFLLSLTLPPAMPPT